ncbi:histidine kinase [Arthrobacter psychrolactophilus]
MAAEEAAAKVAQKQRTELARELHDVVTHGLTMIAVQANLGPGPGRRGKAPGLDRNWSDGPELT